MSDLAPEVLSQAADALVEPHDSADGPGGVVGVYLNGDVVFARGFGLANVEHRVPNTPSTPFRLASVSKQFTAMAVAILARRGELSLDDDLRAHFPELPTYPEGSVTVRHLVHHMSGLRDYNELASLAGIRPDQLATAEAALALLARQRRLNFPPGEQYLYCNSGYFLLALLVERVAGRRLSEFARTEMFEPLGMQSSLFKDDHRALIPDRAFGYVPEEGGGWKLYLSQRDFVGAGGVFSTVGDMLPWLVNLDENRLGVPGLLELMHGVGVLNDGTALDYAFGLRVAEDRGLRLVHNPGRFAAFRAQAMRYPDHGLALFVAVNGGKVNPTRLANEIADVYLQALVPDLPVRPPPGDTGVRGERDRARPAEHTVGDLSCFAGVYYSPEVDATYEVVPCESGLGLIAPGRVTHPLHPVDRGTFRGEDLAVRFCGTHGHRASGFTLDGDRVRGLLFERRS